MHNYEELIALCKEQREKGGCDSCPHWKECVIFKALNGVEPYEAGSHAEE